MSELQLRITKLPQVIIDLINEFNASHRKHLNKVLQELKDNSFCQTCKKYIFKHVYSMRNSDMICCSSECVDNYDHTEFYNFLYFKR